ncbi:MAG: hypothetical protein P8H56_10995 [Crocinitomicaceae bacterium]|nr:hypothetical protein [Crocinitomicaceae bacterium]
MKKLVLSLVAITAMALTSFGQAPEGFKYQAVVRDAGNTILNNQLVGMRMTIQQGSIGGTTVYQETFAPTTNAYGLVNLEIGSGTVVSGDFTIIDWANGPYFIETAVDVTGGISYIVMGTSQLMSVPYALHANTAESVLNDLVNDADPDPTNEMNTSIVLNGNDLEVTDGNGTIVTDLSSLQNSCELSIGDTYQGGIIFYIGASGCHGLVCTATDLAVSANWSNDFQLVNAVRDGLYAGELNTERIINNQVSGTYAAQICANFQGGNFGDWYLPSKYELNLMYLNIGQGNSLGLGNVGGFADNFYWSSTESTISTGAWIQDFNFGPAYENGKLNSTVYVRAVRAF